MPTFSFALPAAPLKAATICSGESILRKYLNSVAIDRGHIVATDGNRMFYAAIKGLDETLPSVVIPVYAVEAFFRKAKIKNLLDFNIKIEITPGEQTTGILSIDDIQEHFHVIPDRYPDWKRVIPQEEEFRADESVAYDWSMIADFQKMAKLLGPKKTFPVVTLTQVRANPSSIAHIDFLNAESDSFKARGVVMGLKF